MAQGNNILSGPWGSPPANDPGGSKRKAVPEQAAGGFNIFGPNEEAILGMLADPIGPPITGGSEPPKSKPSGRRAVATEREVTDAKLEAVEARMDTRLVTIESKMDRLLDRVEVSIAYSKEAKEEATEAKRAASNIKWNVLFAALGTLGVILAIWGLWHQGMDLVSSLLQTKEALGK